MPESKLKVTIAGASGWAGSALTRAVVNASDMECVCGISRRYAGQTLEAILHQPNAAAPVFASAKEALALPCDVFVEYTKPGVAKANILAALKAGAHVVVGTSGLTNEDYEEINREAIAANRSVLAVGNFSITAVLLQKFAEMAVRYIPHWELIDYASDKKQDAPSGTVRELAFRLGQIQESKLIVQLEDVNGPEGIRGARLNGGQVHSVRLPGYVIGVEALFGLPDQKLTIRHEAGGSAEPYVQGALMAIRGVGSFVGLKRGLDSVLSLE